MSGGLATYPGMSIQTHSPSSTRSSPRASSSSSPSSSSDAIAAALTDPGVTLVDFTAAWCAPCKQLTPVLHELETEYRGRARLLVIDVQERPDLAQSFRVVSMPTLVLVRDGKEVGRMVGLRPKKIVAGALERALAGHVAITGA